MKKKKLVKDQSRHRILRKVSKASVETRIRNIIIMLNEALQDLGSLELDMNAFEKRLVVLEEREQSRGKLVVSEPASGSIIRNLDTPSGESYSKVYTREVPRS